MMPVATVEAEEEEEEGEEEKETNATGKDYGLIVV